MIDLPLQPAPCHECCTLIPLTGLHSTRIARKVTENRLRSTGQVATREGPVDGRTARHQITKASRPQDAKAGRVEVQPLYLADGSPVSFGARRTVQIRSRHWDCLDLGNGHQRRLVLAKSAFNVTAFGPSLGDITSAVLCHTVDPVEWITDGNAD